MVTKDVADVLTKKALNALAELLHAVDISLIHSPSAILRVGRTRFEFLNAFLDLEVPANVRYKVLDRRERASVLW